MSKNAQILTLPILPHFIGIVKPRENRFSGGFRAFEKANAQKGPCRAGSSRTYICDGPKKVTIFFFGPQKPHKCCCNQHRCKQQSPKFLVRFHGIEQIPLQRYPNNFRNDKKPTEKGQQRTSEYREWAGDYSKQDSAAEKMHGYHDGKNRQRHATLRVSSRRFSIVGLFLHQLPQILGRLHRAKFRPAHAAIVRTLVLGLGQ